MNKDPTVTAKARTVPAAATGRNNLRTLFTASFAETGNGRRRVRLLSAAATSSSTSAGALVLEAM